MDNYCIDCKQRIPKTLFGKKIGFDFEDGFRCEGCGRAKVKKIREGK